MRILLLIVAVAFVTMSAVEGSIEKIYIHKGYKK